MIRFLVVILLAAIGCVYFAVEFGSSQFRIVQNECEQARRFASAVPGLPAGKLDQCLVYYYERVRTRARYLSVIDESNEDLQTMVEMGLTHAWRLQKHKTYIVVGEANENDLSGLKVIRHKGHVNVGDYNGQGQREGEWLQYEIKGDALIYLSTDTYSQNKYNGPSITVTADDPEITAELNGVFRYDTESKQWNWTDYNGGDFPKALYMLTEAHYENGRPRGNHTWRYSDGRVEVAQYNHHGVLSRSKFYIERADGSLVAM